MNQSTVKKIKFIIEALAAFIVLILVTLKLPAQNCPANVPVTITSNPNTYYPGIDNTLSAGTTTINLGTSGSGSTPISSGDLLLLIQMQGAQIDSSNSNSYGNGVAGGPASGYLANASMMAGSMEYVVASNSVPLSGGALTLLNGITRGYKNAASGNDGQYRYQVVRVGLYYNLTLGAQIAASNWNGTSGGVIVISVTNILDFNGQTISAAGAGFRGGGGRTLGGGTGGLATDFVTRASSPFNASKGEGIAGTPRFVNNAGILLDAGASMEGYPKGSYAAGAPGNAGGGGTDGRPSSNDQNSGGGGGSNGGLGGRGGNSWSSNIVTGGDAGAVFAEKSASRLVMGGGGGAGTTNNGTGLPALGFASSGAAGGGIVLINANTITGTGTVNVNGASSYTTVVNDGNGGGGAGGSVLIFANSGQSGITVTAAGGRGGINSGGGSPPAHGPGGGGGGGVVYSNAPVNAASTTAGGLSGTTTAGIVFGSAAGSSGTISETTTQQDVPPQYLNCSVLPVRFKSTSAKHQQNNVVINWVMTDESAVQRYSIEKSTDGKTFSAIGKVDYRFTTSGDNAYSFVDNDATSYGNLYYRIKGIFAGDQAMYSPILALKAAGQENATTISVSPNPATGGSATIRFTATKVSASPAQLRILSVNGSPVWQKQYRASEGSNAVTVENVSAWPNGLYFVQYSDGEVVINEKMIVRH